MIEIFYTLLIGAQNVGITLDLKKVNKHRRKLKNKRFLNKDMFKQPIQMMTYQDLEMTPKEVTSSCDNYPMCQKKENAKIGVHFLACDRCWSVRYCSQECQMKHYRKHKRVCIGRAKPFDFSVGVAHFDAEQLQSELDYDAWLEFKSQGTWSPETKIFQVL